MEHPEEPRIIPISEERTYRDVLEMVRHLSDPGFAEELKKKIEEDTVYVFFYLETGDFLIFSSLKLAKSHVGKVKWRKRLSGMVWTSDKYKIVQKKIIKEID